MATASMSVTGRLNLNCREEAGRIERLICETVRRFKRRGAVVGVSGGIDSAVVASLCSRALGKDRVLALFTPELESSGDSLRLGRLVADQLGIQSVHEDITPVLKAMHCYERRDDVIRTLAPEYGEGYKMKITLPSVFDIQRYAMFSLVVQSPAGEVHRVRLTLDAYLGIVASTNCKQRTRKMTEYYYADRYNYAVAGTPNRLEYDLGFFVKNGDGSADFKPIAHLYKSQVYQLARFLEIPEEIQRRPATTDTYSLEQTQEEFYFSLPLETMDVCLYACNEGISSAELALELGLTEEQVQRVYQVIESKRQFARYLHAPPVLVEATD